MNRVGLRIVKHTLSSASRLSLIFDRETKSLKAAEESSDSTRISCVISRGDRRSNIMIPHTNSTEDKNLRAPPRSLMISHLEDTPRGVMKCLVFAPWVVLR